MIILFKARKPSLETRWFLRVTLCYAMVRDATGDGAAQRTKKFACIVSGCFADMMVRAGAVGSFGSDGAQKNWYRWVGLQNYVLGRRCFVNFTETEGWLMRLWRPAFRPWTSNVSRADLAPE